jgi:hypothetical protein
MHRFVGVRIIDVFEQREAGSLDGMAFISAQKVIT